MRRTRQLRRARYARVGLELVVMAAFVTYKVNQSLFYIHLPILRRIVSTSGREALILFVAS